MRTMVFVGSLLYIATLLLIDVAYTWVDPRVRLAEPRLMPKIVFLWTDVAGLGAGVLALVLRRRAWRAAQPARRPGARCSATRRRSARRWCWRCASRSRWSTASTTGCALAAGAGPGRAASAYDDAHAIAARLCAGATSSTRARSTYSRPLDYLSYTKDTVQSTASRSACRRACCTAARTWPIRSTSGSRTCCRAAAPGSLVARWSRARRRRAARAARARRAGAASRDAARACWRNEGDIPWRAALSTVVALASLFGPRRLVVGHYHVFGTDTHRQRRALPGAQEHPHRVRDRHARDRRDAAAGGGLGIWRATCAAGSTR